MELAHRPAFLFLVAVTVGALMAIGLNVVDPGGTSPPPSVRCPEDAVQLFYQGQTDRGPCVPADNFAPGTQHRAAADGMLAYCPAGHAVIEIDPTEVVGRCS